MQGTETSWTKNQTKSRTKRYCFTHINHSQDNINHTGGSSPICCCLQYIQRKIIKVERISVVTPGSGFHFQISYTAAAALPPLLSKYNPFFHLHCVTFTQQTTVAQRLFIAPERAHAKLLKFRLWSQSSRWQQMWCLPLFTCTNIGRHEKLRAEKNGKGNCRG